MACADDRPNARSGSSTAPHAGGTSYGPAEIRWRPGQLGPLGRARRASACDTRRSCLPECLWSRSSTPRASAVSVRAGRLGGSLEYPARRHPARGASFTGSLRNGYVSCQSITAMASIRMKRSSASPAPLDRAGLMPDPSVGHQPEVSSGWTCTTPTSSTSRPRSASAQRSTCEAVESANSLPSTPMAAISSRLTRRGSTGSTVSTPL